MEKPKLTTLNVKPETKEAFQALKRQLQADLNQTMTDDEALSFLFSKLTEKREPVKEQKPAIEAPAENPAKVAEEVKASKIAKLNKMAEDLESGKLDLELTDEDLKRFGLKRAKSYT